MDNMAKIETYDEFIQDLYRFFKEIEGAYNAMKSAAAVCVNELENDDVSARANKQVLTCCQKLEDAGNLVIALANAIEEEKQRLIKLLNDLDRLGE